MAWVVDSCILLDIALRDPEFGLSSALFLDELRGDGLVVCPVSVVELTPQFGGEVGNVQAYLTQLGTARGTAWLEADTEEAGGGWARYVQLKRTGSVGRRPVADILIGGFGCRFQGLVTRNPKHFEPFYPELTIRRPPPRA